MRRFYGEFVNAGNLAVADEIAAPDQTRAMLFVGFPGLRWTIEETIAEGDKFARRLRGRSTHEGSS